MHHARHARGQRGLCNQARQLHMRPVEGTTPFRAAFSPMQNAHQVDDGLHALQEAVGDARGMNVGLDDFDTGQGDQVSGVLPASGWHQNMPALCCEFGHQMAADESGAAHHENMGRVHEKNREHTGRAMGSESATRRGRGRCAGPGTNLAEQGFEGGGLTMTRCRTGGVAHTHRAN